MFVTIALILALLVGCGCGIEISNLRQNRTALKKTIDAQKCVLETQTATVRKLKIENERLLGTNDMINNQSLKQAAEYKTAMYRGDGAIDRVKILLETVDELNAKIRQLTTKKPAKKRVTKVSNKFKSKS